MYFYEKGESKARWQCSTPNQAFVDSKQVEQMRSHWKSALERVAAGML